MKLFRTFNSQFDTSQPAIQWEGDVRGIIAARRTQEATRVSRLRLRLVRRATPLAQRLPVQAGMLWKAAA